MFKMFHKLNFSILLLTLLSIGSPLFLRAQKIIQVGNSYLLIDEKKGVLLQDCDKIVSYEEKFFLFSKNGENSVLNVANNEIYPVDYDNITDYNQFKNILFVEKNHKIGVYTVSNKKILPPIFDKIHDSWDYLFVQKDGLHGLYTIEGKEIIPVKYDDLTTDAFNCVKVKFQEKFGIINYEGKEIIPPLYEDINYWKKAGCFLVTKDSLIGLIDTTGKIILSPKYKYVNGLKEAATASASVDGKTWGIINQTGEEIIPFIYEKVDYGFDYYINKLASVQLNGKWGMINAKGKTIVPFDYDEIKINSEDPGYNIVLVKKNEKYYRLDTKSYQIASKGYDGLSVGYYDKNPSFIEVQEGDKLGTINYKGEEITPVKYTFIEDYTFVGPPSLIRVKINDKMGVINNLGKEIVPPIYKQISALYEVIDVSDETPMVIVCKDEKGKIGFIQNNGQVITPPIYDSLGYYLNFADGSYCELSENYNSIVCYKGNEIDLLNFVTQKRINTKSFDSTVGANTSVILIVVKNNQYQFIDLKKGVVLDKTFDKVKVVDPYFIVTKNQKSGIIGMDGSKEIAPLIYDEISFDEDKREFVAKKGNTEKRIKYKN